MNRPLALRRFNTVRTLAPTALVVLVMCACSSGIDARIANGEGPESSVSTDAPTTTGESTPGLGSKLGGRIEQDMDQAEGSTSTTDGSDESATTDGSDDATATTESTDSGSDDPFADPATISCLDSELTSLDSADQEVILNDGDFSELSGPAMDQVATAFDACVSPDALVPTLAESFGDASSPELTECLTRNLDGQVGTVLIDLVAADAAESGAIPESFIGVLDECIEPLLTGVFTNEGASETEARCIAGELVGRISVGDLADIGASGEIPSEIESIVQDAASAC